MESSRGSASPRTVLVIDDDPEGLARIARALGLRGFDVATGGASAGGFQRACDVRPSVVVVVLNNPAGGGLALIRLLATHHLTQRIPVVVAGCEDESLHLRVQEIGNVVVVMGTCSEDTVATEVERVITESVTAPAPPVQTGFPVPCPKCAAPAGMPRRVTTTADGGTYVSLQCEACAEEWRVYRQANSPGFEKT